MSFDKQLSALTQPDLNTRLEAIESLTTARYVAAIPQLITLLADPEPRVRVAATKALGEFHAAEAVSSLATLLSDPDSRVRAAVRVALKIIGTNEAREIVTVMERMMGGQKDAKRFKASSLDESEDTIVLSARRKHDPIPAIVVPEQADAQQAEEAKFSAYYPKEIAVKRWESMIAYVFKAFAAENVIKDAQKTLGGEVASMRRGVQAAKQGIPEGTMITAKPYLPGFQFNPSQITIGFYEDWHRFDFKMRAADTPLEQASNGYIMFTVNDVIVSSIPLSVFVTEKVTDTAMVTTMQKLYKAIFCSYSHDDTKIVERVARAYKALGFDYLRDVETLKSGQDWDDELYRLIERADIFQLFWSASAAQSEYVEREWRHALGLDRDEVNFIRPVYWEEPMPPAPEELSHIHFAFQPELDE